MKEKIYNSYKEMPEGIHWVKCNDGQFAMQAHKASDGRITQLGLLMNIKTKKVSPIYLD